MQAIRFAPSPEVHVPFYRRVNINAINCQFVAPITVSLLTAIVQPVFKTEFFASDYVMTHNNIDNQPGRKPHVLSSEIRLFEPTEYALFNDFRYLGVFAFRLKNLVKYFFHFFR